MRYEESYERWQTKQLMQEEAAQLLGVSARTFRRYVESYEEAGLEGLLDKRLNEVSHRRAPVDEVVRLEALHKARYDSWDMKHFYSKYKGEHEGQRSTTWVKNHLQKAKRVKKGKHQGAHRKRRERAPLPGMMPHQDGSTHAWVEGKVGDLTITMDDATREIYSGFFCRRGRHDEQFSGGIRVHCKTRSVQQFLLRPRQSLLVYTRGRRQGAIPYKSFTVQDKFDPVWQGLKPTGNSDDNGVLPQARGRSERMFKTLQARLPKALALHEITDREIAKGFLKDDFLSAFNAAFQLPAAEPGSAFVPVRDARLKDILCIQEKRTVGNDNGVRYNGLIVQLPKNQHRAHDMKAKVRVHHYPEGNYALFPGPRQLACYDETGSLIETPSTQAVA